MEAQSFIKTSSKLSVQHAISSVIPYSKNSESFIGSKFRSETIEVKNKWMHLEQRKKKVLRRRLREAEAIQWLTRSSDSSKGEDNKKKEATTKGNEEGEAADDEASKDCEVTP
ncbi:hypothetical protein GOBAR_AA25343 [Gossypium barbadense]|uniref:Uncharacterized protein n=1 Tax=Gossypium barbadense TaxID=3634 RepID=A0A2P5WW57_GOSBA|nr:hypothetical protein GOBAR_AA25343 [Gossypium barbadense]